MMKTYRQLFLFVAAFITTASSQEYQDYQNYQDYADDYQQDNLYADYAMKQQEKVAGWVSSRLPRGTLIVIDWFLMVTCMMQ